MNGTAYPTPTALLIRRLLAEVDQKTVAAELDISVPRYSKLERCGFDVRDAEKLRARAYVFMNVMEPITLEDVHTQLCRRPGEEAPGTEVADLGWRLKTACTILGVSRRRIAKMTRMATWQRSTCWWGVYMLEPNMETMTELPKTVRTKLERFIARAVRVFEKEFSIAPRE
jgi:hypothetical protein